MANCKEQNKLLRDISMVDFVIIDMNLYLDTHPDDQDAIQYISHYIRLKNQLSKEYAAKFGPLTLSAADDYQTTWKWAQGPMPWEGGF